MELKRYSDPEEFYARIETFLQYHEAEHNLMLGIAHTLIADPKNYPETPYMAVVEDADTLVGVALRTPPYNILFSHLASLGALDLFAEDLLNKYGTLPGVNSRSDIALAFAERWQALTGQTYSVEMSQRIYSLVRVKPVEGVSGHLRKATADDRDLLEQWMYGFHLDATGEANADHTSRLVEYFLSSPVRGLYLWEDGEPVSMAGFSGPTPRGIRVNAVYTPPDKRRRGYASACVAALSQILLDSGRLFCFLYTDLDNPTSNHIYQDIGYQPVCDAMAYRFEGDFEIT